jgi:glutathione S-transferase
MAIIASGVRVVLREIKLRDKPAEMLAMSPKGTVPVLVLCDGQVIDESLEIMRWALSKSDPHGLLAHFDEALIAANDGPFKAALDRYKYPNRYGLQNGLEHRCEAMLCIGKLDEILRANRFLAGDRIGLTDVAIVPFIRQFVATDAQWFGEQGLDSVTSWLEHITSSDLFTAAMVRYPVWQAGDADLEFPLSAQ